MDSIKARAPKLFPLNIDMIYGTNINRQDKSVLWKKEQWGEDDDPSRYLDISPIDDKGRAVTASFLGDVDSSSLDWYLSVDFRGWSGRKQFWQIQLYNFDSQEWDTILNNNRVEDWVWSSLSSKISSSMTHYMDSGEVLLRIKTEDPLENAQIDFMVIHGFRKDY